MLKLNLPSGAVVALGLLAGVLSVLNTLTFGFSEPWKEALTVGLLFLSGLGIAPLVGPAFRNALHLSHNVVVVLTSLTAVLGVSVQTFAIGHAAKAIVIGVITLLAGLGFGALPAAPPVVAGAGDPRPPAAA